MREHIVLSRAWGPTVGVAKRATQDRSPIDSGSQFDEDAHGARLRKPGRQDVKGIVASAQWAGQETLAAQRRAGQDGGASEDVGRWAGFQRHQLVEI